MTRDEKILKKIKSQKVFSGNKIPTTIRFDENIIEFFKERNPKWQTEMNRVLQLYVQISLIDNRL